VRGSDATALQRCWKRPRRKAERELNALFADKKATSETVSSAVATAATAQGKLRETHLRYHLSMMKVLTPAQVTAYQIDKGTARCLYLFTSQISL
jgi:Spy/CpxP family protein refolding chaperone